MISRGKERLGNDETSKLKECHKYRATVMASVLIKYLNSMIVNA